MLASKTFPYSTLADLKGKVLGGLSGVSYGEEVDAAVASGLFSIGHDTLTGGRLAKLLYGRIDAALVDGGQLGLESALESVEATKNNAGKFVVLSKALVQDPLHLAFPKTKDKKAAIDRLNAALFKMKNNGDLKRIFANAKKTGK